MFVFVCVFCVCSFKLHSPTHTHTKTNKCQVPMKHMVLEYIGTIQTQQEMLQQLLIIYGYVFLCFFDVCIARIHFVFVFFAQIRNTTKKTIFFFKKQNSAHYPGNLRFTACSFASRDGYVVTSNGRSFFPFQGFFLFFLLFFFFLIYE